MNRNEIYDHRIKRHHVPHSPYFFITSSTIIVAIFSNFVVDHTINNTMI